MLNCHQLHGLQNVRSKTVTVGLETNEANYAWCQNSIKGNSTDFCMILFKNCLF